MLLGLSNAPELCAQNKQLYTQIDNYINLNDSLLIENNTQLVYKNVEISYNIKRLNKNPEWLRCINDVLKGIAYSIDIDELNDRSDYLFKRALAMARKMENRTIEIWCLANYSYYLYYYDDLEEASKNYVMLLDLLESSSGIYILTKAKIYQRLGFFTGYIGDYQSAITYLKRAIDLSPSYSRIRASSLDNLGSFFIKLSEFQKAEYYLNQALMVAKNIDDPLRVAKVLGNMGLLQFKKGNLIKSFEYLHQDVDMSLQLGSLGRRNAIYALKMLEYNYLSLEDYANAEIINDKIYQIGKLDKRAFKDFEYDIISLQLALIKNKKDDVKELALRRRLDTLKKPTTIIEHRSDGFNFSLWNLQKLQHKYNQLKDNGLQQKIKLQRRLLLVSVIAICFVAFFILNIYRRRNKLNALHFQRKISTLNYEMIESEKKLDAAATTLSDYLKEKNALIKKLEDSKRKVNREDKVQQRQFDEINQVLSSHLMTDENWYKFRTIFSQQYPKYYQYLIKEFPELTENNIKLIILLKLKLNNIEIGRLLGVSASTITKSKQRLKKKIGEKYELLFKTKDN